MAYFHTDRVSTVQIFHRTTSSSVFFLRMSVKFFFVLLLAVVCTSNAAIPHSHNGASTIARTTVQSAGSLRTVSRQDDDYFDEDYPEDFSDEDFGGDEFPAEGESEFSETESEPEPEPMKPIAPKTKSAPKPESKPEVPKPKLHMEYTMKYPNHCKCILQKGTNNGICYEYTTGKKCKGRKCKPSYVCIDGKAPPNAVTCMRKKNTKQIVSNGDGTCKTKSVSAYAYKPYTS